LRNESGSSETMAVLKFGVLQHVLCFSLSPLRERARVRGKRTILKAAEFLELL
jgi:hypothetical protein